MVKRWNILDESPKELVDALSNSINVNRKLSAVLVQRGINSYEEAKKYFRPSLNDLHDPFLMKDMGIAVNRIHEAVSEGEKILIYGDYDVDGTTSVAMLYLFLLEIVPDPDQISYYIPDREEEGYGLSMKGIAWAKEENFKLIVALDCGILAFRQAEYCLQLGIELIICDHHLPQKVLPNCLAVLNPKRADCTYPFKELSGCGIGFKLLTGFCIQNNVSEKKKFRFLDLVSMSIASDMVSMTGENRILAYHGLKKINKNPSPGIQRLIKVARKYSTSLKIRDLVFSLGPRINAAGRLMHARFAVDLLIGKTVSAEILNQINTERQEIDRSMTDQALMMVKAMSDKKATVLFDPKWHKGVVGIVASRCIECFYKPTIILTQKGEKIVGSGRSVEGFDLHKALTECSDVLGKFGGHQQAVGLELSLKNLSWFEKKFEKYVAENITREQQSPSLKIDCELNFRDINFKFYNILKQMAPFGPGNLSPVFYTKKVSLASRLKVIKDCHLKGFLKDSKGCYLEFIAFDFMKSAKKMEEENTFEIAYHIDENDYNREKKIILVIKDFKFVP